MQNLKIYIVDDDEDDRFFLKEAINNTIADVEIVEALDGDHFLHALDPQDDTNQSALIFLDMNMPRVNGLEVVEALQSNKHLKNIPVFMISTSKNQDLVNQAYKLGVNRYFTKPNSITEYHKLIEGINFAFIENFLR